MCGVTGFFGPSSRDELLQQLNHAQRHRGPDGCGIWFSTDREAGLAHRRLAIVDLSANGAQPMESSSGRYTISYNGEIYNFLDLRSELLPRGHCFRGTSDTEVMLAAFEEWGIEAAVARFNGMFAAAVWDRERREGSLFRDRLGVKPLFYQWYGQSLFFASELTAPFSQMAARSISTESLVLFLQHGYIPGEKSIYEGIYKLSPGVIATTSVDAAARYEFKKVVTYWNATDRINDIVSSRDDLMSEEEAVERIDNTLHRSVKRHMISDVPLGAFLSGGVDSSLIVSHMQENSTKPVKTFTIGFHESNADEAPYARRIARHLGTDHTELYVTEQDALCVVPLLPQMYGEPFADSSQIPTFMVSKLIRRM